MPVIPPVAPHTPASASTLPTTPDFATQTPAFSTNPSVSGSVNLNLATQHMGLQNPTQQPAANQSPRDVEGAMKIIRQKTHPMVQACFIDGFRELLNTADDVNFQNFVSEFESKNDGSLLNSHLVGMYNKLDDLIRQKKLPFIASLFASLFSSS